MLLCSRSWGTKSLPWLALIVRLSSRVFRVVFYSSGAQVKGLGAACKPPTITGNRNWKKISAGKHPDRADVVVDTNYGINIIA